MYFGLGISAICFIIHGFVIYGWDMQNARMSLNWIRAESTLLSLRSMSTLVSCR